MLSKSQLRRQALAGCLNLCAEELFAKSLSIQEQALSFVYRREPLHVLSYCHIKNEVPTSTLNAALLQSSTSLVLPRVVGDSLQFFVVGSYEDLVPGYAGILEPCAHCCPYESHPSDLLFLPGLLFDRCGYRLGYGKAFYDRFLAQHPHIFSVALAFELQLVDSLPTDPHDVPVKSLLTESHHYYI